MTYRHPTDDVEVSLDRLRALLATRDDRTADAFPVRMGAGPDGSTAIADGWNLRVVVEELTAHLEEQADRARTYAGEPAEILGLPYRPLDREAWVAAGGEFTSEGTPLVDPASQFEAIAAEVVAELDRRASDGFVRNRPAGPFTEFLEDRLRKELEEKLVGRGPVGISTSPAYAEDELREMALRMAVDGNPGARPENVVGAAKAFVEFLRQRDEATAPLDWPTELRPARPRSFQVCEFLRQRDEATAPLDRPTELRSSLEDLIDYLDDLKSTHVEIDPRDPDAYRYSLPVSVLRAVVARALGGPADA